LKSSVCADPKPGKGQAGLRRRCALHTIFFCFKLRFAPRESRKVKGKKLYVKNGSSRFADIGKKGRIRAARGEFQYSRWMAEDCRRCSYKRGTIETQKAIIQGKNRGEWGLEVA